MRLGPAWARCRGTATPETDPLSRSHRPAWIPRRRRARSSRPRVALPRPLPCPWWAPVATLDPSDCLAARVRLPVPCSRPCCLVAAPGRRGACRTAPPSASSGPAARHRVAERWIPPPFNSTSRRYRVPGRACPAPLPAADCSDSLPPGETRAGPLPSGDDRREARRRPSTVPRPRPRPRSNLQHHPDGLRRPSQWRQAVRCPASLAERSSRRHTRSPGEAGGGHSDLCHDNDEPDAVNR
jgi:hypothetical protein